MLLAQFQVSHICKYRSILDIATEHFDIFAFGRVDQTRPSKDHDHLYDRRPLERCGRSSHPIQNRKFFGVPVAVSVTAQVICSLYLLKYSRSLECFMYNISQTLVFAGGMMMKRTASRIFAMLSSVTPMSTWVTHQDWL